MSDYPTEEDLVRIETWPVDPPITQAATEWLAFIQSIWWAGDWGWADPERLRRTEGDYRQEVMVYRSSTGGWSGNESIIASMHKNVLWSLFWESSRRGGHYEFRIPLEG